MVNKKYGVIGVASIIMVAAIIGVAVTVTNKKSSSSGSDATPSGENISATQKAVKQLCAPTDYKETCESTLLSAAGNTTNPKELIKVAFNVAVSHISGAIKNSSTIQEAGKDPRSQDALENCRELLEFSINDLKQSFEQVGDFDMTKMAEYMDDLKTWLSGAVTYQQTCLDGFDNTTGDAGEKMRNFLKTSTELTSNGLAIVTELSKVLGSQLSLPKMSRRLMSEDGFPSWVSDSRRKLLAASPASLKPNVVVAKDGSGKFKTINEALKQVPLKPKDNTTMFVIYIKAGVYVENVNITKKMANVFLVGDGPTKTKITGSKSYADGITTYKTSTVSADGPHFMAKDIGFENSAGSEKHQAVALRVSSDRAILYNVQIDGYQDTLYCHTHRQFYRDCTISGTIDFIFGNAAAVFQNCKFVIRAPGAGQNCMVTAQGRTEKRQVTGIVLQNCVITGTPEANAAKAKGAFKAYLGRPWKNFSRTIIMNSKIDNIIDPEGWAPWAGDVHLKTLWYAEYKNSGPGANKAKRVKWIGIQKKITDQAAQEFTAGRFLSADLWVPKTGVPYASGMM